jgi:hypothetical protein
MEKYGNIVGNYDRPKNGVFRHHKKGGALINTIKNNALGLGEEE